MHKYLIPLIILFSLPLGAMEVAVKKSQEGLNQKLFALVQSETATAEEVYELVEHG